MGKDSTYYHYSQGFSLISSKKGIEIQEIEKIMPPDAESSLTQIHNIGKQIKNLQDHRSKLFSEWYRNQQLIFDNTPERIIHISQGSQYISDHICKEIKNIPFNCILDKGRTGCGATTMYLDHSLNSEPTVVLVPLRSILQSKENKVNDNTLYIYGSSAYDGSGYNHDSALLELKTMIRNGIAPHIMATYEKLSFIINLLAEVIDLRYVHLVIDEYHRMITDANLRDETIITMANHSNLFRDVTLISATPIEKRFLLDQFRNLTTIHIKWNNKVFPIPKLHVVECNRMGRQMQNLLVQLEKGKLPQNNFYFFINNIHLIEELIHKCKLNHSNTRIIAGRSISEIAGIKNTSLSSESRRYTFLTSSAYEGADIYDPKGITFIVAWGRYNTMQAIPSIDIIQATGRNRALQTPESYLLIQKCSSKAAETIGRKIANLETLEYKAIEASYLDIDMQTAFLTGAEYCLKDNDGIPLLNDHNKLILNPLYFKKKIFDLVSRSIYKAANAAEIISILKQYNINVASYRNRIDQTPGLEGLQKDKSFNEIVKAYAQARRSGDEITITAIEQSQKCNIRAAYESMPESMFLNQSREANISRYLERKAKREKVEKDMSSPIMAKASNILLCHEKISLNKFIDEKTIKDVLTEVFKACNLPTNHIKANVITQFYQAIRTSKMISGVKTNGYKLIRQKVTTLTSNILPSSVPNRE